MVGTNLYEKLCDYETLYLAWLKVKTKGSVGGIDKISIEAFEADLDKNLRDLVDLLNSHRYIPEPYQEIRIPKKNKDEFRSLSLPTVRDKIVQQAAKDLLDPILDKEFLPVSYAYRENKGPTKAIRRVLHMIRNEKRTWVTLCDIDKYFDTIDHNILFHMLSKKIEDEKFLQLIQLWVKMGKLDSKGRWKSALCGIPQGAILSPLLANLYLHPLDHMMVQKNYGYVRYADDFTILTHTKEDGLKALTDTKWLLEKRLMLRLNPEVSIKKVEEGFEFLGVTFKGSEVTLGDEKLEDIKERINKSLETEGDKTLNSYILALEGLSRYYGQILPQHILEKIDEWCVERLKSHLNRAYRDCLFETKSQLEVTLSSVTFLSQNYQLHRHKILKEIASSCRRTKKSQTQLNTKTLRRDPIKLKKRQYEKIFSRGSELVINTPGTFLGKTKRGIVLKRGGTKLAEVPCLAPKNITILCSGVTLSSSLIHYCAHTGTPIFFAEFDGKPYATIYPFKSNTANIIIEQIRAFENKKAHELAKSFVIGKIKNQVNLVKYFFKYKKRLSLEVEELFYKKLSLMKSLEKELRKTNHTDIDVLREKLLSLEGRGAGCYWELIQQLLKDDIDFEGRERKGATDLVNSLLNYGYGILYSRVWLATIKAGLNPYISYLHKPQDGKPTLTFDLIEEFRQQAVDRPVLAMLTKGERLQIEDGKLTDNTRKRVAEKVLERLNTTENFRGREITLQQIIEEQATDITAYLQGKIKIYRPYIGKW